MSAASVTAYLSPTILRKRAISSGESGGAEAFTIFIFVTYVFLGRAFLVPLDCGAAQPVIDRFAEPVIRHRHHRDRVGAPGVEDAKITEKVGGGFLEIAARGQIHHRSR